MKYSRIGVIKVNSLYSVAEEFVRKYGVHLENKTIEGKMRTTISNSMEVLGASLSDFTAVKGVNGYKIDDELKDFLIDTMGELVMADQTMGTIANKASLNKDITNKAFGYGSSTADTVFVVKHFVKENFKDDVYEPLKEKLRESIRELENKRRWVNQTTSQMGDLTKDMLYITRDYRLFDFVELEKYFHKVQCCYKEYTLDDDRRLNENDMIILEFLGLQKKLKFIDKQLMIEIAKIEGQY